MDIGGLILDQLISEDENGEIPICPDCGKPKKMRLNIGGKMRTVGISCDCTERLIAEQKAQQKRDERRMAIDRFLAELDECGALDKGFSQTFAQDDAPGSDAGRAARKYCDRFDEFSRDGIGILFGGGVGTGKTFYAACIANELAKHGRFVIMTSLQSIASAMSKDFGEKRARVLHGIRACDLLVLDDLGAERNTEYMQEQSYEVVNERYKTGKPMIVTTNLSAAEINNADSVMTRRICERVRERCKPVKMLGISRREAGKQNTEERWNELMRD